MNSFYNMWNYDYIQQQAQANHFNQIKKVQDAAKSLKDFLAVSYTHLTLPTKRIV